ncbi:hypothetical protein EG328_005644 [Venturia inaequalis]|uniref:Transmembrane protein n=1 Tax=Venturia inaequalis TaxID=5025 RepID=A0A8H3VH15_VENIN|nr:hypothetical protein EG328_005644 [Venturia inaequalis]RDI78486.1 hypothetical protein Vi05172_g11528 [Venturia inaequalis]
MLFFALPTALLALVPAFLSSPVAASPAAQPQVTPLAQLEARANGANIIGYSSSGTGLRTRSCNNGFFSSSGTLGNCCASASCAYITACRSSYVFYAGGSSAFCGSTGSCGTGVVLKTVGDSSPLSVFNCDSNWRVTATLSASSTSSDRPTTVTSVRTTGTTATVISSITQAAAAAIVSVTSATAQLSSSALSLSASSQTPVTLTVTNSQGQQITQVTILAAGASGSSSSSSTATVVSVHNNSSSSNNTGPIAGGIVGGIALIALAALGIFFLLRRKSKQVPTAVPVNNNPEYFAPTAGSQQMNDGQPPRFSQVEYMNNPPAMAQTGYPQNQAYAAYVPPIAMAGKHQQDYKYVPQQDIKDGQRGVETNVVPSGPLTPMEHPQEVYGSPVPTPGLIPHPGPGPQEVYGSPVVHPVEMPAHAR